MLKKIPMGLVVLRFFLGPGMWLVYLLDASPSWYMAILTLAFLSDFFDGVIARRLGVSTDNLRSLDSWADTVFYLCVFSVALGEYYTHIKAYWLPIAVLISMELLRHVFDRIKFGKSASYHMWSAKLWGLCLYLGFMQLLGFGDAGVLFLLAIVVGIAADIEGLLASVVLSSWRADVPSLYHAIKIERT